MIRLTTMLEREMRKFMDSPARNQWIQTDQMQIYVRKGLHRVNRHTHLFLDIANIQVDEHLRGQGLFRQVVELFKHLCGTAYEGVYIESILNSGLRNHLSAIALDDPQWYNLSETNCFAWIKPSNS